VEKWTCQAACAKKAPLLKSKRTAGALSPSPRSRATAGTAQPELRHLEESVSSWHQSMLSGGTSPCVRNRLQHIVHQPCPPLSGASGTCLERCAGEGQSSAILAISQSSSPRNLLAFPASRSRLAEKRRFRNITSLSRDGLRDMIEVGEFEETGSQLVPGHVRRGRRSPGFLG